MRALVQLDDTTAALMELPAGQPSYFGARTQDGLMVMRPAWKHEYAYPLGEPQIIALSAYRAERLPRAPEPRARPVRPSQARSEAQPAPVDDRPAGWRTDRLVASLADKQFR